MVRYRWLVVALALVLVLAPSCAKKQVTPVGQPVEQAPPPAVSPGIEQPPPSEQTPAVQETQKGEMGDVYFAFDKYNISDEYKPVLTKNAEYLMSNTAVKVLVEGHCDERGTVEYNLALGEKRAKAVVDFYTSYGVPASRVSLISYGKERPFANGHDEAAWAQNRRAHMVLQ